MPSHKFNVGDWVVIRESIMAMENGWNGDQDRLLDEHGPLWKITQWLEHEEVPLKYWCESFATSASAVWWECDMEIYYHEV